MLTRDDLLAALGRIHVVAPVRADEVTVSTNDTALQLAGTGAPQWTLVAAAHQTGGRGRLGRTWADRSDAALLFSFVLRPRLAPARWGLLSLLAGAAMARSIREVGGAPVECKWPNDLLLGGLEARQPGGGEPGGGAPGGGAPGGGAKVGGVLLESVVGRGDRGHVVVGIGVNLTQPPDVEGAAGIGDVDARELLGSFLERFARIYGAVEPSWPERVRGEWLPVSGTIGRLVEAKVADGSTVRGRAVGIDDAGGLRLSVETGEVIVGFGEIQHLGTA